MRNEVVIFMDSEPRGSADNGRTAGPLPNTERRDVSQRPGVNQGTEESRRNGTEMNAGKAEGFADTRVPEISAISDAVDAAKQDTQHSDQSKREGLDASRVAAKAESNGEPEAITSRSFFSEEIKEKVNKYHIDEPGQDGQIQRIPIGETVERLFEGLEQVFRDPEAGDPFPEAVQTMGKFMEKYSGDEEFERDVYTEMLGRGDQAKGEAIKSWIELQLLKMNEGMDNTTEDNNALADMAGIKDSKFRDVISSMLEPLRNERGAIGGGGGRTGDTGPIIAAPPPPPHGGDRDTHGDGGRGGHDDHDAAKQRKERRERNLKRVYILVLVLMVLFAGAVGKTGEFADYYGTRFYSK